MWVRQSYIDVHLGTVEALQGVIARIRAGRNLAIPYLDALVFSRDSQFLRYQDCTKSESEKEGDQCHAVSAWLPAASRSLTSTSTATLCMIASKEMTTRNSFFLRTRNPATPAITPALTRTLSPTFKYG